MLSNLGGPAKAAVFYAITLGLALLVCLAAPLFGETSLLITMLTPVTAVLIIMLVVAPEGRATAAWTSLGLARAGLKGWPLAILGPVVILLASYAIILAAGFGALAVPDLSRTVAATIANMGLSLLVGVLLAAGEEVGWRGYMLSRLSTIGLVPAMLIVGFLHGVWHLPLMLTTPYYHSAGNVLVVVPLFLVTLTLAGVFYGYLRVSTGSVWPVVIAHAVYNFVWGLMSEFVKAPSPETLEYVGGESGVLVIAGLVLVALVLVPRMRNLGFEQSASPAAA